MMQTGAKIREARLTDSPVITEFNLRMAWETEQRRLDADRVAKVRSHGSQTSL